MLIALCIAMVGSGPLAAPLGNGATVYLSYLSDAPLRRAWRPDGMLTSSYLSTDRPDKFAGHVPLLSGELEVLFMLKVRHTPKDIRGPDGSRSGWQPTFAQIEPNYGQRHSMASAAVPNGKDTFECERLVSKPADGRPFALTLKVAATPWQTISQAWFHKGRKVSGGSFVSDPARVTPLAAAYPAFPVHIPPRWKNYDYRLMAFDLTGRFHPPAGTVHTTTGKDFQWFTCSNKDVARVLLQVRPFKTVEFAGIQPQPMESPQKSTYQSTSRQRG